MEEVIDIRTLQCYQKATEEQRKKCTSKLSFEIGKLPTLKLQEEWTFYIKHCGEVKSLSSVRQETVYFKRVCEFMNHLSVDSMKVQTKAVWGQQFESWVSAQGLKAYRESNKNKNWRERTPIVLYFLHMLDFIDSEMSGQRIYFKDLACYQEASEEERKKCGREPYFDLSLLPTQQLRKEWGAYIKESARIYTLGTSFQHRVYYNQICRFLNSRIVCAESMREQSKEKWERQFKRWLMTEGIQINRKSPSPYSKDGMTRNPNISYLLRMLDFTYADMWKDETEKDVWELDNLSIEIKNNPIKKYKTLNFTNIRQPDMKNEIKKGIYLLLQREAIATVSKEMTAGKRLTEYLYKKHPQIQSLGELDRDIFEEYLIHLKTDRTRTKSLHAELTRLRALLEAVGKTYKYPVLENLIINRDIPPTARAEFRTYSDEELKRLNAEIVKMNEQIARLMILHQMLGTRISDTLTLRTDCLRGQSKMRRNNRSRRGKIPQKEYTKHAIIRRTAQCLQGVEGILPKMVDEPTSALDPISTSKIEDLAMELKKDYTIVMVTHNMQQAVRVSDNTAFFLLGEVVEYNNTEKLFSIPQNKKTEDYITGRFG